MRAFVCRSMAALGMLLLVGGPAWAEPGVTDREITIGSCSALSGPAAFLGT
jgi:hypothetical protein